MIIKRVKASKVKDKGAHIGDLIKYITNNKEEALAAGQEADWRVGVLISRGFICDDVPSQIAEMVALSSECVKSKNPVNHYVMSWKEGEHPTDAQANEAVDIFTKHLGLDGCQVIAAMHRDTENRHLHVAVNRIDPDTHQAREINNGLDIEAAHEAAALIQHKQGWTPEKNGRKFVSKRELQWQILRRLLKKMSCFVVS